MDVIEGQPKHALGLRHFLKKKLVVGQAVDQSCTPTLMLLRSICLYVMRTLCDAGQVLSYPDSYLVLDVCLLLLMAAFEILRVYCGKINLLNLLDLIHADFTFIASIHP